MIVGTSGRIRVPVISLGEVNVRIGDPIAQIILLPDTSLPSELVAVGQKVESKPSPFEKNLTPDQEAQLDVILTNYQDIFADELIELGQSTVIQHRIETMPDKTTFSKPYKQCWENDEFIEAEVERMLKAGIIEKLDIDTEPNI